MVVCFSYNIRSRLSSGTFVILLLFSLFFYYSTVFVKKEQGTMDGKKREERYNLMNCKTCKERFSTDCFSDYVPDYSVDFYV